MSKKQREADVEFLRNLAEGQGRTWKAAIEHAADELEAAPMDGKPKAEPPPLVEDEGGAES